MYVCKRACIYGCVPVNCAWHMKGFLLHARIHTHTHTHTHKHTHTPALTHIFSMYTNTHPAACTYTFTNHPPLHTHTHIFAHTHTHLVKKTKRATAERTWKQGGGQLRGEKIEAEIQNSNYKKCLQSNFGGGRSNNKIGGCMHKIGGCMHLRMFAYCVHMTCDVVNMFINSTARRVHSHAKNLVILIFVFFASLCTCRFTKRSKIFIFVFLLLFVHVDLQRGARSEFWLSSCVLGLISCTLGSFACVIVTKKFLWRCSYVIGLVSCIWVCFCKCDGDDGSDG